MDSGYIEVVPARDLRVGDVFSTDGGIVVHVGISDVYPGVYVETVCHGIGKDGVLDPEFPCPLWRENES